MSKTPKDDLPEAMRPLQDAVNMLAGVLNEPHPGLMIWLTCLSYHMQNVHDVLRIAGVK